MTKRARQPISGLLLCRCKHEQRRHHRGWRAIYTVCEAPGCFCGWFVLPPWPEQQLELFAGPPTAPRGVETLHL